MIIKNICKILYFWGLQLKGLKFASCGKGSYMIRPDRIIGAKNIHIGENVSILHHARIEAYSRNGGLFIEDGVTIEQNLHLVTCEKLVIGANTTISANVYISDCNHEYKNIDIDIQDQGLLHKRTEIGQFCFIGYGAVILPGVILGKQCIIGANAVVCPGKYDDYSVLAGVPAKIIRKYNFDTNRWENVRSENV